MSLNLELWDKIASVEFDAPATQLRFSDRLARENRWSRAYAERVLEEYRRFAYLAVTAGHEVTPSDEVDQAWHLHLTYTRHYWGEFCDALGTALHHGPTRGGASENTRYSDNYEATLASYEAAFGEAPPRDIWPPADIRFGAAPFMARVNTADLIMMPRRLAHRVAAMTAFAGAGLFGLAAAKAAPQTQSIAQRLQDLPVAAWIAAGLLGLAVILLIAGGSASRRKSSGAGGSGATGGCAGGGKAGGKSSDGGDSGCSASGCGGGCGGS